MLFNTHSQKVLTLLKDIGEKAIFTYPVTGIRDATRSMVAFIDFEKLENPEFPTFGLIKIKEFLDLSRIVSEDQATITLDNNIITIEGDGVSCRYITTDISVLSSVEVKPNALEAITKNPVVADFVMDVKTIDRMKKVSALLNLEDMVIDIKDNNDVKIMVSGKDSDDNMTLEVPQVTRTEGEYTIVINILNLKKLPIGDYQCTVLKHATMEDGFIVLMKPTNEDLKAITIVLATKAVKKG